MTTEEGEAKAKDANLLFLEASAQSGYNVKQIFQKIAEHLPGVDHSEPDPAQAASSGNFSYDNSHGKGRETPG